MNTTFIINGGAGRVITAIPALEKHHLLYPNDDFRVIVHGWGQLYWNHPLLQNRTFDITDKGIFDSFVKNSRIVCPEPYYEHAYINQECHLIEAFDKIINETDVHSDLNRPNLYTTREEVVTVSNMINKFKDEKKKDSLVVFQPYGSGMAMVNDRPFDSSYRSFDVDDALNIIYRLSQKHAVIYFGEQQYRHPGDMYSVDLSGINVDMRFFMAVIEQCDYFIGCDSLGQHIAHAFNVPGKIMMGSTFEKNVSYPNHFEILRNDIKPTYMPYRICDATYAERLNSYCMKMNDDLIERLTDI